MQNQISHAELVQKLSKRGEDIIAQLTPEKAHLWHMATGISGESGELEDAIKKHVIYNKPLDRENVIEELGDLEFYMEGMRQGLGITREEVLLSNIAKLAKRYPKMEYSNAAATPQRKSGQTKSDVHAIPARSRPVQPDGANRKADDRAIRADHGRHCNRRAVVPAHTRRQGLTHD